MDEIDPYCTCGYCLYGKSNIDPLHPIFEEDGVSVESEDEPEESTTEEDEPEDEVNKLEENHATKDELEDTVDKLEGNHAKDEFPPSYNSMWVNSKDPEILTSSWLTWNEYSERFELEPILEE